MEKRTAVRTPRASWIGTLLALLALVWTFRNTDLAKIIDTIRLLVPAAWLIVVPFGLAQLSETAAWRWTFIELGHRVSYWPLLRVRLSCEAIAQTLPGGMLIAEAVKPGLLGSQCGLRPSDAVAGTASRKLLLLVTQCVYFGIAVVIGIPALRSAPSWYIILVCGAWFILLAAALSFTGLLSRGNVCRWMIGLLTRLPIGHIQRSAESWRSGFNRADERIRAFCAIRHRDLLKSGLFYLGAWCLEAAETVLIFKLLAVPIDWQTLCLIEVCSSMVRHIAFVAPAGVGFQDLSYAGMLHLFGVGNWLQMAATFTLLKRGKELLWSCTGYLILASLRKAGSREQPSAEAEKGGNFCAVA